jgi:hypothetical protein
MAPDSGSHCYSIHDLVTVESNTDIPVPDRFIVPDSEVDATDLTVERGPVDIEIDRDEMTRCQLFFFGQSDDTFVIDYKMPVVDARLMLTEMDGSTRIRFTKSFERFGDISILVNTVLLFKLLQRGYTFVHAGSVERDGTATLLAGMRDTGKTSTVLSLVDGDETRFMSDDLTLLGADGTARSYPTEVGISPFTLTGDVVTYDGGRLKQFLVNRQWLSFAVQNVIGVELSERKRVPDEAIAEAGQIDSLFVLGGSGHSGVRELDHDVASRKLLMTTAELLDPFRIYTLNFYAFYLDFDVSALFDEQRRIIRSALDDTSCYDMTVTDIEEYPAFVREYW